MEELDRKRLTEPQTDFDDGEEILDEVQERDEDDAPASIEEENDD